MIDREYLDRQLYWFLTREPLTKIVVVAGILGALFFGCMICYASALTVFSSPDGSAQSQNTLPTRVDQAHLPATFTPQSSQSQQQSVNTGSNRSSSNESDYGTHTSVNGLVHSVAGSTLKDGTLYAETYTRDLDGNPYPGGRKSYDVDFVLNTPETRTRNELLLLGYELMHEFYYNFPDAYPMFVSIHLRANENAGIGGCVLGVGIGYQAAPSYLPNKRPSNLEAWFRALWLASYYGDLPDQTDALLAYGNDPADFTNCYLDNWMRQMTK